ncbi:MAG: zinc-binding dehydrogenase [Candidatus Hydrogenedentes bacterium]|nr:zinc-binding dehydrogenase [Candidatus Hydrogenedentota bacterium]MBI3119220.1 zinc-binding dehydrogenase [Candidatus Hydrogenedentota bacterium]
MKAAVIRAHGSLDVLETADVPPPSPGRGEVLLNVRTAALNHLDIWIRKGRPGLQLSFPHVLGSDAAGVVAAVGESVTNVAVGDEVILNPGLNCGRCPHCLRGQQSECPQFTIMGMGRPGTFAEQTVAPAENLQSRPPHLTWEESAALPLAYLTAWRMLHTRAKLQPGETVLIHGIGGGVALAALQLVKAAGGEAIVTSGTPEKLERAAKLGAAHTINYRETKNVAQRVLEITSGAGVDVAFDAVGAATWPINFEAVRKGGRIVHCGVTTGAAVETNIATMYWKQLTVLGSTMGSQDDFRQLVRTVRATGLRPVVDSVHPLQDARQAQERMEQGEQFGKIVLRVAD